MEMLADVKTDTVGKTEKEVEAQSVYIDAGRSPGLWRRKGGGGMEVVEAGAQTRRTGREAAARANHPRRFAPIRGLTPPPSQTYHQLGLHVAQSKASSCSMTAA